MNTHPEQELLSPFIDGELTEREQVTLEAHLASCEDCRSVLDALRATLGDLALVGEAPPSEQDSWALRSAIAKERRLNRRGRRWYLISGSAAAALVGILAFALSTGGSGRLDSPSALTAGPQHGPQLQFSSVNHTEGSAKQVLLSFAGTDGDEMDSAYSGRSAGGAGGSTGASPAARPEALQDSASITMGSTSRQSFTADENASLDRCVGTVPGYADQALTPRYYEAASFEGTPVFLLVFEAVKARRLELWVLHRDTCEVKFWAQTRA